MSKTDEQNGQDSGCSDANCYAEDIQTKPPLGIPTEWMWKQKRCYELVRVIARYDQNGRGVSQNWFTELGELIPQVFPQKESDLNKF
tara:strand:+ start:53 stop:313 length:261 start_codon:yes stop_codon:yes gene_type:complete